MAPPYGLDQPADIKSAGVLHPVSELRKGALRFLDLETTGPVELMPGVICEAAPGANLGLAEGRIGQNFSRTNLRPLIGYAVMALAL